MDWSAFFTLHKDLPREGPGEPADVAWACALADTPADARICDAACGPGADIAALLAAAPKGHVTGIDKFETFIEQAAAIHGADPRVSLRQGDMATLTGPFDLIWCAGAVYFLGVTEALTLWRAALTPGGAVAFSEPCWFTDTPSPAAQANWAEYPPMTDAAGIAERIAAAGYDLLGTRRLSEAAWEAYYTPMEARITQLKGDPALEEVLAEGEAEIAASRNHGHEAGYLLHVVRPK